jgi:signal transduction histidine kinase
MLKAFPEQDHDSHIAAHRAFMATRMVQINPMVYALLQGHISDHIALKAHGEIGDMVQNTPELQMQAQQDPQGFKILFDSMVAKKVAEITMMLAQEEAGGQKEDPLVALKQRELDLRAMDLQRKAMENQQDAERKEMEFEERLDFDKMKLESAEDQAEERIRIAEEKIDLTAQKMQQPKKDNKR